MRWSAAHFSRQALAAASPSLAAARLDSLRGRGRGADCASVVASLHDRAGTIVRRTPGDAAFVMDAPPWNR